MMDVRETIAQAKSYGEALGEREARVARGQTPSDAHRAWFGTDFHNRPVAYFEIGSAEFQPFAVSQVIEVAPVSTTIGTPSETVLAAKVTCREHRLDDVFIAFMDEVTQQLGPRGAVDVLVGSAAEWRNLLRLAQQGMSSTAAAGLYGELRFLDELMVRFGPSSVVLWQRDGHDVHDFISSTAAAEIKTSSFQNQQSVTIHGLKQLEPPSAGALFLAVAEVEKHGAGESLDQVVDRILDHGAPLDVFTDKLAGAGFVRGMSADDESLRFSLRSWRYWAIDDTSPVITPAVVGDRIASSVGDVTYSLQLGALGEPTETIDWKLFQPSDS